MAPSAHLNVRNVSLEPPPNAKTVHLSRGRHPDPEHGVCVMELASMLSGDYFTDCPRSVCPALAGFLRGYNDRVRVSTRKELYPWAAHAVGTRTHLTVADARERVLISLAAELRERARPRWRRRRGWLFTHAQEAGEHAGRAVRRHPHLHRRVEEVLGALCMTAPSVPLPGPPAATGRSTRDGGALVQV